MALINVDIGDTLRKAEQISQLSKDVSGVVSGELEAISTGVPTVWTGDGAQKYQRKLDKINQRINNRAKSLKSTAVGVRASAIRIQRAEAYALSLFQKK